MDLIICKLMQLGTKNQIVDDSDYKLPEFDCQFQSDLDCNDEIVSMIVILLYFDLFFFS